MTTSFDDTSDDSDVGRFEPLGSREPTPLYRARPDGDEAYFAFLDEDGFACFVNTDVPRDMSRWADAASGLECIGRLAGRQCEDGKGPYVLIEKAAINRHARSDTATVVADFAAQAAAWDDFLRSCRAWEVSGWIHTHPPGCGAFFSSVDRLNQRTWTHRNSIGIVIDPSLPPSKMKVYRGPNSVELTPQHDLRQESQQGEPQMFDQADFIDRDCDRLPTWIERKRDSLAKAGARRRHNLIRVAMLATAVVSVAALTMSVETRNLVLTMFQRQANTAVGDRPVANVPQTTISIDRIPTTRESERGAAIEGMEPENPTPLDPVDPPSTDDPLVPVSEEGK